MTWTPIPRNPISRRTFVSGSLAAVGATVVAGLAPAGAAHAADSVTISADGVALGALADGTLVVRDGGGVDRVRLTQFMVKDSMLGQQRTFGGTPSLVSLPDGRQAIEIAYRMSSTAPGITVRGRFTVAAHRVHFRWEATSANELYLNSQFGRTLVNPSVPEAPTPLTRWNRDAGGGVPFETNDGMVYAETWADTAGYMRIAKSNPAWTNASWMHVEGAYDSFGVLVHEADLVLGDMRAATANALAATRPVGVDIWSDQPFNLWHGAGSAMTLQAQAVNGGPESRPVELSWTARDFDGEVVAGDRLVRTLGSGETLDHTISLPAPRHGIVFIEVRAHAGADESFARTTLSSLPQHQYSGESIFGISNYPWLLEPSKADVAGLLQLLGVASVRIAYDGAPGIPPAELEALGITPNIQHGDVVFGATPEDARAWAVDLVDTVVASRARYFEVDNERNQPWMSGQYTQEYIRDGLRPVVQRLGEVGSPVKVMNCGLGGMDVNWTANFHANGGWDLIDAFTFHPGRGNFTPDFAPAPDEWVVGNDGSYWNFLGAVREAKRRIEEYGGDKELWLTEAYACTRPNHWWNDTMRQAAENVFLTMALCKAEGVDGVNWYQLHDTTIHHPQEASPTNPEYHFGLMNRDTSAKPSLLAFAAANRLLEQARFVRWLDLDHLDEDLRGLLFETPDGPVSVVWTRKDGYLLNADHDPDQAYYPHPEAWEDDWPTKTDVVVRCSRVREVDCIGRDRVHTGRSGRVTLRMDGAPRAYYGLSANPERILVSATTPTEA
jgi:hypothetical protein